MSYNKNPIQPNMIASTKNVPVITIDGPSGTGKGSICHMLAAYLGWNFLDSGALYRIVAFVARNNNISIHDVDKLVATANSLNLRFAVQVKEGYVIFLGDQEISQEIRSEQCGQDASKIAAIPEIRAALLGRQREFAQLPGLVTDGRDMGTVVFPDAILKIFLYATAEERALRRYLQLKELENDVSLAQIVDELAKRDKRDTARIHSPLKPAQDAFEIDTTGLTVEQVFTKVLKLVNKRLNVS